MSESNEAGSKSGAHMPAVLGLLIAVIVVLAVPWIFIKHTERGRRPAAAADAPASTEDMLAGERVYQRNCVSCHEARGEGRPGQYPSLIGAPWLLEDKETPIRITLLGAFGAMDVGGQTYRNVMPNFGVNLTDTDLANVLTFARGSWGTRAPPSRPRTSPRCAPRSKAAPRRGTAAPPCSKPGRLPCCAERAISVFA
ncbi:MAG: cytochrome c [Minicystis sp.]